MTLDFTVSVLITIMAAATPLLFASLGELVVEKSGVLNLGIEGMMLAGAVAAFAVGVSTGSGILGVVAGTAAGALMAFAFGVLTLTLAANQVATGLALTIFGIGLSALLGASFVGVPVEELPTILEMFSDGEASPIVQLILGHDLLVYLSIVATACVAWFLKKSRAGMILRAVGESDISAHSIGYNVIGVRYRAVIFGGAMSGLAGSYLSLSYTPMWAEEMTAGRGWIALALVVFASWRPWRVLMGAYLFGGVTIGAFLAQGLGVEIPAQVLNMLPYLATILVLTLIAVGPWKGRLNAPACLGIPFRPST